MTKIVAVFNPMGGSGRTTTALYLAWTWAAAGHRVVLIDADPGRALTRQILDRDSPPAPAGDPPHSGIEVPGRLKLVLVHMPPEFLQEEWGHQESLQLPAPSSTAADELLRVHSFITASAAAHKADFLVIDLGPNLRALNRSLVLSSHGILVPMLAHYLCRMALNILTAKMSDWLDWRAAATPSLQALFGAIEVPAVKLLGTLIRQSQAIGQTQSALELGRHAAEEFIPALTARGATFSPAAYQAAGLQSHEGYRIAEINDFRDLIEVSRQVGRPILGLTDEQLRAATGRRIDFRKHFTRLADRAQILLSPAQASQRSGR